MIVQINHTLLEGGQLTIDYDSLVTPHSNMPMCRMSDTQVKIGTKLSSFPAAGFGPAVFMAFKYPNGSAVNGGELWGFNQDHNEHQCMV